MLKTRARDKQRKRWREAQQHSQEFMVWLKEKVGLDEHAPTHIRWLSLGPCDVARKYVGYCVNGYKFYTKERDAKCKTQNSGVSLIALTSSFASTKDRNPIVDEVSYYGAIQEIIEVDYWSCFSVVLFRCDWFCVETDDYGLTRVNFEKRCYVEDPFVLASQVHQVFYVEDPIEKGWHYAIKTLPKDFFDFVQTEETYFVEPYESPKDRMETTTNDNDDLSWCREDIPHTVVELDLDDTISEQTDI
ncbi:xylulose kinase-2 [Striga asiatica]|uniref:Xylulose kinase-2 n=1 Tax=Striga asiatica TaxID=4170 RepID=A0A5A7Q1U0_STRAF|nr:xylulose kinase-2 [Striga asiatica]